VLIDHVTIRASDRWATERFLDTVLPVIGIEKDSSLDYGAEWEDFSMSPASEGKPVTQRLHVGFGAGSRAEVDAFWQAGVDAGYRSDGEPGPRPQYNDDYYGAFLLDPDGTSIEAVHYERVIQGNIDHVWIRVADVAASIAFYELAGRAAGFVRTDDRDDFGHFKIGRGEQGSFSVLPGEPTVGLHMAFASHDDAVVQEFHRSLTAAGYRDNGPPGERTIYHPGYYGAFVLDPDGNNIEVVNHHRYHDG
jgi:catechol 2,3-dioxygenase-like lactoylglutathione lyase family enzyme